MLVRALELARQLGGPQLLEAASEFQVPVAPRHQEEARSLAKELAAQPSEWAGAPVQTQFWFLSRAGEFSLQGGQRAGAEILWRQGAELATRTHDPSALLYSLGNEALLATLEGRLEEAAGVIHRLLALGDELGSPAAARGR